MNNKELTLRDQKNKAIAEELLSLVGESYLLVNSMDILRKKRQAGNEIMNLSEPKMVYFYLLKKHTDMSYREVEIKLSTSTDFEYIQSLVSKVEVKLRNKENSEFIVQVKIIERDILKFIANWKKLLLKRTK